MSNKTYEEASPKVRQLQVYIKTLLECGEEETLEQIESIQNLLIQNQKKLKQILAERVIHYLKNSQRHKNRIRLLFIIDSVCKSSQEYAQIFKNYITEYFIDIYYDYLRPDQEKLKNDLKIMRKSWVSIFPDKELNQMRTTILEKINDDIDAGFTKQQIESLREFYIGQKIQNYEQYLPRGKSKKLIQKSESDEPRSGSKSDNKLKNKEIKKRKAKEEEILKISDLIPKKKLKTEADNTIEKIKKIQKEQKKSPKIPRIPKKQDRNVINQQKGFNQQISHQLVQKQNALQNLFPSQGTMQNTMQNMFPVQQQNINNHNSQQIDKKESSPQFSPDNSPHYSQNQDDSPQNPSSASQQLNQPLQTIPINQPPISPISGNQTHSQLQTQIQVSIMKKGQDDSNNPLQLINPENLKRVQFASQLNANNQQNKIQKQNIPLKLSSQIPLQPPNFSSHLIQHQNNLSSNIPPPPPIQPSTSHQNYHNNNQVQSSGQSPSQNLSTLPSSSSLSQLITKPQNQPQHQQIYQVSQSQRQNERQSSQGISNMFSEIYKTKKVQSQSTKPQLNFLQQIEENKGRVTISLFKKKWNGVNQQILFYIFVGIIRFKIVNLLAGFSGIIALESAISFDQISKNFSLIRSNGKINNLQQKKSEKNGYSKANKSRSNHKRIDNFR